MEPTVITVSLPSRSYPVVIGSGVRRFFGEYFARTGCRRAFWVTDANVARHWQAELDTLRDPAVELIILPPGEEHKRLSTVENLCRKLMALGAERSDVLVACGGGVIGDLVGFTASVYQRGIAFIQMPTTLLAMVDASVGGKTGVDLPEGKNLVGTFQQPALVLTDPDFLRTLPARERHSGFAEVIKTALIGEEELFTHLYEKQQQDIDSSESICYIVERCVNFKSRVVSEDETDKGWRAILNFGHTIGHALEVWGGYQTLQHGEAVMWGMSAAVDLSQTQGLLKPPTARRIFSLLERPLAVIPTLKFTPDQILPLIARDKKVIGGRPRFVLLEDIGKPVICSDVKSDSLISVLHHLQDRMNRLSI